MVPIANLMCHAQMLRSLESIPPMLYPISRLSKAHTICVLVHSSKSPGPYPACTTFSLQALPGVYICVLAKPNEPLEPQLFTLSPILRLSLSHTVNSLEAHISMLSQTFILVPQPVCHPKLVRTNSSAHPCNLHIPR